MAAIARENAVSATPVPVRAPAARYRVNGVSTTDIVYRPSA
jgi:hypothetical protein